MTRRRGVHPGPKIFGHPCYSVWGRFCDLPAFLDDQKHLKVRDHSSQVWWIKILYIFSNLAWHKKSPENIAMFTYTEAYPFGPKHTLYRTKAKAYFFIFFNLSRAIFATMGTLVQPHVSRRNTYYDQRSMLNLLWMWRENITNDKFYFFGKKVTRSEKRYERMGEGG